MGSKILFNFIAIGMFVLIFASLISAFAANMTVAQSGIGYMTHGITANELKPSACTQNLTNIVRGAGSLTGTSGNDLIIGSTGADTIDGLGGDDCILGGGGDDSLDGNDGSDVCLGGYGANNYFNCETTG